MPATDEKTTYPNVILKKKLVNFAVSPEKPFANIAVS